MINYILNIIYPPKCILCQTIIAIDTKQWICEECQKTIEYLPKQLCQKCNTPLLDFKSNCCFFNKDKIEYGRNISVFVYDDIISTSIKNGKYNNHPSYFKGFAVEMGNYFKKNIDVRPDYIVPVPIHKKRLNQRGFNQAEIISTELSKQLAIPSINNLLIRVKNTKPQSEVRSHKSRINNIKDAFIFNTKYKINTNNIMLVDDIYTTGSTINACRDIIKENGANEVYSFCLALTIRKEKQ